MKKKFNTAYILILAVIVILSIFFIFQPKQVSQIRETTGPIPSEEISENIQVTNGVKHIVPLDEILSGGPPKDGIPSIDDPKFVSVSDGDKFLDDDEIVFGIFLNGEARAYPKQILVWHEIVNDDIKGQPVLITYCPLCGTAIAFERKINNEAVEFGTSGKLYKSNLVMYDRKTDTYWSQVGGIAIVGELTGTKLKQLPIDTLTWGEWKKLHTDTIVLSRETGQIRPYGVDPYGDYYTNRNVGFGATFTDTRLHPKAMVSGIVVDGIEKAYPFSEIVKVGLLNEKFGNVSLLITKLPDTKDSPELNTIRIFNRTVDGEVLEFELKDSKIFDKFGGEWSFDGEAVSGKYNGKKLELIPSISAMWFSWLSIHPNTELYLAK